jgi:hypothetical protein
VSAGSVWVFVALTYLVSWTCFITAGIRSRNGDSGIPSDLLLLIGTFAPSLVAFGITRYRERAAGVQRLLEGIFRWEVAARWYVLAVGYMAIVKLSVALVYRIWVGSWLRFGADPWYLVAVAAIFSTPVQAGEEIGWRGFALPRLAGRFGLVRGTLLLGVIGRVLAPAAILHSWNR